MFPGHPNWGPRGPLSLRGGTRRPAVLALKLGRELQRRPLIAKCVPTAIGFAFGDVLTQFMNRDRSKSLRSQWHMSRTASMLAIGAVAAGPVLLSFNRWMDLAILPHAATSPVAVGTKFLLDQVCFHGDLFGGSAALCTSKKHNKLADGFD